MLASGSTICWQEAVNQQVNVFELTFPPESNSTRFPLSGSTPISFLSHRAHVYAYKFVYIFQTISLR